MQAVAAGDVDDLAAILPEHLRNDGPAAKQGGPHVDVEKKIPIRKVGFMDRLAAAPRPDGVNEGINAAKLLHRLRHHRGERTFSTQINAAHEQMFRRISEEGKNFAQSSRPAVHKHGLVAGRLERTGGDLAEIAGGARDNDYS